MTGRYDGRFGDSRAVGEIFNCPFECWVRADISRISIELFDATYKNGVAAKTRTRAVTARRAMASAVSARSGGDARQRALCGYQAFYSYSAPHMRVMRDLINSIVLPWS